MLILIHEQITAMKHAAEDGEQQRRHDAHDDSRPPDDRPTRRFHRGGIKHDSGEEVRGGQFDERDTPNREC